MMMMMVVVSFMMDDRWTCFFGPISLLHAIQHEIVGQKFKSRVLIFGAEQQAAAERARAPETKQIVNLNHES